MNEGRIYKGAEVVELLLGVRLDGVMTGYASAILRLLGDHPNAEEVADRMAEEAMDEIIADPLVMEAFRQQIAERLMGIDSGPLTVDVHRA